MEHVCQACLSQISISYISLWPLAERGLDICAKKPLNPKRNGEIDKTRGSRQFLLNILRGYDADTGITNVLFPVQRVFWFQLRCMYADVWHAQKRVATGRVDSQLGFFSVLVIGLPLRAHSAATLGLCVSSPPSFSSQLHYGQLRLVHLLLHTFVSILYILSVICLHFLSFKRHLSPSFPLCVCAPGVISLLSSCFSHSHTSWQICSFWVVQTIPTNVFGAGLHLCLSLALCCI